ncbi:MAG: hypothetical protein ACI8U4_001332 [Natronomonas sp.]|jgi:hypothetical protein
MAIREAGRDGIARFDVDSFATVAEPVCGCLTEPSL